MYFRLRREQDVKYIYTFSLNVLLSCETDIFLLGFGKLVELHNEHAALKLWVSVSEFPVSLFAPFRILCLSPAGA